MVDWERSFLGNGVIAAVLFIVSFAVYGSQPKVGSSADKLVSFYDGDSTRILLVTIVFGFATLCLIWFAVALASVLRDAGMGGWGTAATAAGAAIGAVYFIRIPVRGTLAYSIAGSGNEQATSALNDVSWATTTWAGNGFWAAAGGYARFIPTIVMLLWIAVVSAFLMRRQTASAPGRAAVPAA
jgi:hypothetical protein